MIVSAMSITTTGLAAASKRVEASAANIVNMRTTTSLEDAQTEATRSVQVNGGAPRSSTFEGYRPLRVHQETLKGGGVRSEIGQASDIFVPVFDPKNQAADARGLVARPKIDAATEAANQMLARNAYLAGLSTAHIEDEMLGALLYGET